MLRGRIPEPKQLYIDVHGDVWEVTSVCHQPTVRMVRVDTLAREEPIIQFGGVNGCMWNGFRRLVPEGDK